MQGRGLGLWEIQKLGHSKVMYLGRWMTSLGPEARDPNARMRGV